MKLRVIGIPGPGLAAAAWALALGFLGTAARAQSPEASAFADPNSPFNETNPTLDWTVRDRFDRSRFMDVFSSHFILSKDRQKTPEYRFFPPTPPLLDSELPVIAPLDSGITAPEPMSGFVAEVFYPLLAARLATDDLPKDVRQRILSYHDRKIALTGELRARILALKDADPAEKGRQLGILARSEASPIAELNAEAEKIRAELRTRNVFGYTTDTEATTLPDRHKVHSVAATPGDPDGLLKEAVALMDAAFFSEGLSPAQRKLVFESAIELRERAMSLTGQAQPGTRIISFSPATARIRIPEKLGDALEAGIRDYTEAKDALKAELREALHAAADSDDSTASASLAGLAHAQSRRIARTDDMAEEIRSGLALLPNPPGPPVPRSLPPELAARISDYRVHKVRLLRALRAMLTAPAPTTDPSVQGTRDDPAANALAWMHDGSTSSELHPSSLSVSPSDFDREQTDMIAELNKEQSDIRESLAAFEHSSNGPSDTKSVNDLLRDFEEARTREEIWEKYRDYQAAVLMPGLSAGQRQLLFDTAIGELGLPLPTGDRIP